MNRLLNKCVKPILARVLLGCLLIPVPVYATELSISLSGDQLALEYPHPVRIEQVFTDIIALQGATQPTVYPLANQLFNLDKQSQVNQEKQRVVEHLQTLADRQLISAEAAGVLKQQIQGWAVAYREKIDLDFDQIRTDAADNPMLQGNYELITPERTRTISFEGALYTPQDVEFDESLSLSGYLSRLNLLKSADPSYAWVIYPDGNFVRSGYAYWNSQNTSLTPGSIIFVGFKSGNKEVQQLEQQVVQLIIMRRSAK
ncbi:capsule biosynthesis GfcC family protein [Vibrio sinaloensis]|uniref:capsule biosynthesis GfcC family protein n=1 Tax=Photobacterium sp. (strain ATCC 43367) TaxID=379097 RepID=UPI000A88C01F|nr:capsule biosynthesis GfcC family protein [Vibrio sinaloensis]